MQFLEELEGAVLAILLGLLVTWLAFGLGESAPSPVGLLRDAFAPKSQTDSGEGRLPSDVREAIQAQIDQAEREKQAQKDKYITGIEKPDSATQDVWDVLPVDVRRKIYARDCEARDRIYRYTEANYPILYDSRGWYDLDSVAKNEAKWEALYIESELEICIEYDIPEWMLFQIIREGIEQDGEALQRKLGL